MSASGRASADHARLVRKLSTIAHLTPDAIQAIEGLPLRLKDLPAGADIVSQGESPTDCCLVLDGWVFRYTLLPRGQRQIHSFHIPGDIPDLQSLHLSVMDHSVATLTPCRVAFIPHPVINDLILRHPSVLTAFWRDTLIDAAVFREWMVGIGRRSANQRIAHLFCELFMRLRAVDQTDEDGFRMYVTQVDIADSLGLTSVHVNRVLQEMRRDGLIATQSRRLQILDWDALKNAGDFDPTYLHLRPSPSNVPSP